jgi:twitching motility protein PilT
MDQALLSAIKAKEIDPEQAYLYASDKKQFQQYVSDMSAAPPLESAAS